MLLLAPIGLAAAVLFPSGASAAAVNCVDTGATEQVCKYRMPITVKGFEVLQETSLLTGRTRHRSSRDT